jgi:hypothetical protein
MRILLLLSCEMIEFCRESEYCLKYKQMKRVFYFVANSEGAFRSYFTFLGE